MLSKATKILNKPTNFLGMQTRGFASAASSQPKRVVVTGAAGQIAYSTLFRIARYQSRPLMFL